jgi:hypothetical protein
MAGDPRSASRGAMAKQTAVCHSGLVMGDWWVHDNLHMHVVLDMNRLVYIEYVFH